MNFHYLDHCELSLSRRELYLTTHELSVPVSTIPEETEDQLGRVDRKLHLQQGPLLELSEDNVQASARSEPIVPTHSEPIVPTRKPDIVPKLDIKTCLNKTDGQKNLPDSQKICLAPSDVKPESNICEVAVTKTDHSKELTDAKLDSDCATDKVVFDATNKASVKNNAELSPLSPRASNKPPADQNSQKVSPKGQQSVLKSSVGGGQKVSIPPLVKVSEKSNKCEQSAFKSPRNQRKDPRESHSQPSKLPDAVIGRNFEDTSVQHKRGSIQAPQRLMHGQTPSSLIIKEITPKGDDGNSQRSYGASNKTKQGVKFPALLSVATGGSEKRKKSTSSSRHSDRPKTRDSLISVPFDSSLIDYYSDDFDDSSDSEVDEG